MSRNIMMMDKGMHVMIEDVANITENEWNEIIAWCMYASDSEGVGIHIHKDFEVEPHIVGIWHEDKFHLRWFMDDAEGEEIIGNLWSISVICGCLIKIGSLIYNVATNRFYHETLDPEGVMW